MTRCTVVLATYNGGAYISQQLESIAVQTRLPAELIVTDDGSTDATLEHVAAFALRAPFPVRVLAGPRRGYADNFWTAARTVGEGVVAWSDQDDVWSPTKLEACVDALDRTGADLVSHAADVVDADLRSLGGCQPAYRRSRVLGPLEGDALHVPSGFASVVRRHVLDSIDWISRPPSHQHGHPLGHDHATSLAVFAAGRRVQLADRLARYRQHGSNAAGALIPGGAERVGTALGVDGDAFRLLGRRLRGYATWLEAGGGTPVSSAYFLTLAARADLRANVRDSPARLGRAGALGRAAVARTYQPRRRGGFGSLALGNDLVTAVVGLRAVER